MLILYLFYFSKTRCYIEYGWRRSIWFDVRKIKPSKSFFPRQIEDSRKHGIGNEAARVSKTSCPTIKSKTINENNIFNFLNYEDFWWLLSYCVWIHLTIFLILSVIYLQKSIASFWYFFVNKFLFSKIVLIWNNTGNKSFCLKATAARCPLRMYNENRKKLFLYSSSTLSFYSTLGYVWSLLFLKQLFRNSSIRVKRT